MSLYTDRVAAGLCGSCGKAHSESSSLCVTCKEKAKIRAAAKREKRTKAGECVGCGVKINGGIRCRKCKDICKEDHKARGLRWKAAGLCWTCGKRPPKKGITVCETCSQRLTADASKRYHKRKEAELCNLCGRERAPGVTLCRYHLEATRDYRSRIKLEALEAYGGPICVGCNEDTFAVLELDHIDGGGCKHRKEVTNTAGGHPFYLWVRRENYPPGLRVLCPTCNKKAYAGIPLPNQTDLCSKTASG